MSDRPEICPRCKGSSERKIDPRAAIMHFLCTNCSYTWTVPQRIIDHDLPFTHKPPEAQ